MAAPCLPGWQGRAAPWLQTSPGCCRHSPSQPGCGGAEGGQVIFPVSHIPPHPLCQRKGAILNPSLGTGPSPNKHLPAPPEGGKPHTKEPTSCEAPAAGQGDTPGGAPLPAPAPHGADLGGEDRQTDRQADGHTTPGGTQAPSPQLQRRRRGEEPQRGGPGPSELPGPLRTPPGPSESPGALRAPSAPPSPSSRPPQPPLIPSQPP